MYILVKSDHTTVYPYSIGQLRRDNPNVIFSGKMTDTQYEEWGVYRVVTLRQPIIDDRYQRVVADYPVLIDGVWTIRWRIEFLTTAEVQLIANSKQEEINKISREYLDSTDWYVVRSVELGIPVPEEILSERQNARTSIVDVV